MDIIQLLPNSVANQIAAGEVIQRPASVIKELVENAVDAGAKTIQVAVVDAGRTSIQVIDDGCGMSDTDARLSFERHATSKIRKADDLFALHTMGFRGEALASIAAVAQVTLQTRQATDDVGTKICLAGCKVTSQEVVSCPVGSNFLIENLFFNVPARRKFLKSNTTEMSNITQAFERIVLVYPEISFILYNNGQEVLHLRAGSLRQRIIDVFGKRLNQQILPIGTDTTLCKLTGFVGVPESAKKKGAQQYFFVNGRYMKHPYFHKAVQAAYDRIIPAGEQIPYFIYMEVPPEDIDVNIHPVKTEIKFENETAIWQILLAAVRDAVGKFSGVTAIDFNTEDMPDIPVYNPAGKTGVSAPKMDFDPTYNPFKSGSGKNYSAPSVPKTLSKEHNAEGWESLYGTIEAANERRSAVFDEPADLFPSIINEVEPDPRADYADRSTTHLQYKGSYIITPVAAGLMITDQHRAHVRILFEEYMQRLSQRTSHTQKILFPEVVQFPPNYIEKLPAVLENMRSLGFDIDDLGGGSYAVNGIPGGLSGMDSVTLVNELVSAAIDHGSDVTEEVNSVLALELADRAATPYGEVLSNDEMEHLISQLLECETQKYTPDGRTVISLYRHADIERLF